MLCMYSGKSVFHLVLFYHLSGYLSVLTSYFTCLISFLSLEITLQIEYKMWQSVGFNQKVSGCKMFRFGGISSLSLPYKDEFMTTM